MKHIPTKRGGNYSHTMRNGTDVYNFSYYDIDEVNKIITALQKQNEDLLTIIKWANNHGGLGYSIHAEFEKAIAKAGGEV